MTTKTKSPPAARRRLQGLADSDVLAIMVAAEATLRAAGAPTPP